MVSLPMATIIACYYNIISDLANLPDNNNSTVLCVWIFDDQLIIIMGHSFTQCNNMWWYIMSVLISRVYITVIILQLMWYPSTCMHDCTIMYFALVTVIRYPSAICIIIAHASIHNPCFHFDFRMTIVVMSQVPCNCSLPWDH